MKIKWNKVAGYGLIWLTLGGLVFVSFLFGWHDYVKTISVVFFMMFNIWLGIELVSSN